MFRKERDYRFSSYFEKLRIVLIERDVQRSYATLTHEMTVTIYWHRWL